MKPTKVTIGGVEYHILSDEATVSIQRRLIDELQAVLAMFVAIDDADKSGQPLISNQGQGMDGYTKLANYDAVVKQARKLLGRKPE